MVSHLALAVLNSTEAGQHDERDRSIALRGERAGRYVLAARVFGVPLEEVFQYPGAGS